MGKEREALTPMAYAYWRGKSVWIGWTDSAGVPHRERSAKAKNITQGRVEAIELERRSARQRKGLPADLGGDTLFGERALQWLAELPAEYASKATAETYVRQRILPFLGDKPCRSIGRDDVRAMLRANEEPRPGVDALGRPITLKAAAPGTKEKLRAYVHTIFEWLIDDLEVVTGRNPAGGRRMRVKVPKQTPRYIPVSELAALVREVPSHYRLLFVFAVVTGARKGELLPLTWEDVSLEQRRVHITKSRDRKTTKGGRDRFVFIPEWLVPALIAERQLRRSALVFPNARGERHRFDVKLTRVMRAAARRAGLVTGYMHLCRGPGCRERAESPDGTPRPCPRCGFMSWVDPIPRQYRFKDLRSTFGTLATSDSGDIRYVQQVLGHESVRTTEGHYIQALSGDVQRKTDALTAFRGLAEVVSDLRVPDAE